MNRILLDNLEKTYCGDAGETVHAVKQLTLETGSCEYLVVTGPSASGKSTLLRLIAGLESPSGGEVYFDECPMSRVSPRDRDLAMVFQQDALFPHMTVRENIGFGLQLRRIPREETQKRVADTARMLGLEDCLNRLPEQISGGQRQRAALGRAVVRRPKLILLDEPLSSLDAPLRVQLRSELRRIHRELGCAVIHVTHDQSEAMALGDRIAVLNEGSLAQVAIPQTIYSSPANAFVAGFIGSPPMNLFEMAPVGIAKTLKKPYEDPAQYAIADKQTSGRESRKSPAILLGIRCEDVRFQPFGGAQEFSAGLGTVHRVESQGAWLIAYGTLSGHEFTARIEPGEPVAPNRTLPVYFNVTKACWFDARTGKAV